MTTDMRDDGLDGAFADPALADLLAELRTVADQPAPRPGPALSALLAGATPIAPVRARRSRTASAVVIGLVSSGVLAGGVGAAAANELPPPVQRVVSRVVNTFTPFEIPHPDQKVPADRDPDDDATLPQPPADRDEDTPLTPSGTPRTSDPDEPAEPEESQEVEELEELEESGGSRESDESDDSDDDSSDDGERSEPDDDSSTEEHSGERSGDRGDGSGDRGAEDTDDGEGHSPDTSDEGSEDSGSGGDDSEDHGD